MKLESNSIKLRLIEESDASFVLGLRLDENYNKYLSSVNPDLNGQVEWIKSYKIREAANLEYYFIIARLDNTPVGTVRLYEIKNGNFTWGSWILNQDKTRFSAIESALLVYEFGFRRLNLNKSVFEVMKANSKVISFHEKFGAIKIGEDDENVYFELPKDIFIKNEPYFQHLIKGL